MSSAIYRGVVLICELKKSFFFKLKKVLLEDLKA